jgi:hypothetical protein
MNNILYIAVSGKIGSGKDYITENYLAPLLDLTLHVSKMAFADQIKINIASKEDRSIETILTESKTPEIRLKMQHEGTEQGRDKYGPDIWVRTLENWVRLRVCRGDQLDVVFITDCRFPNEAEWVERHGGLLIRVDAPDRNLKAIMQEANRDPLLAESIKSHLSETALDAYPFKYTIDNREAPKTSIKMQLHKILQDYLSNNLDRLGLFGSMHL